jgi:hypothetical protein
LREGTESFESRVMSVEVRKREHYGEGFLNSREEVVDEVQGKGEGREVEAVEWPFPVKLNLSTECESLE